MTTTAAATAGEHTPAGTGRTRPAFHATAKVTAARVLRSEWTKLTSLRSTMWTLLAAVVVTIGLGALVCWATVANWDHASPADRLTFQPVLQSMVGAYFSQVAIGVLGVLLITGEYSTGMIRTSLGAVPHRLPMLFAKAAVFAVTSFVVVFFSIVVAFLAAQAVLAQKGLDVSIGSPGVVRALLGMAFFVTVIGLLGLCLGTLIRSTGGSIATVLGLVFVVPIVLGFLPGWWRNLQKYIPSGGGQALVTIGQIPGQDTMSPLTGLVILLVWLAVGLAAAAYTLVRRDA